MTNQTYKSNIQKLIDYSNKKDFDVSFVRSSIGVSYVCFDKKKIVIDSRQNKEYQLYDLVHEVGHIEIETTNEKKLIDIRTEHHYVFNSFHRTSLTHKIEVLQEEINAWNIGEQVAKSLGIVLHKRKFTQRKAKRIGSYVKWIALTSLKNKSI